jgi:hypothetical protein
MKTEVSPHRYPEWNPGHPHSAHEHGAEVSGFINELTPWSRVHEKLIVAQLVKKFPAFYGTPGFITVFKRAHY